MDFSLARVTDTTRSAPQGDPLPFMTPAGRKFMKNLVCAPLFAHHPTCSCFDDHLLRLNRLNLCLGCTCMAVGGSLTVTLLWALWTCGLISVGMGWKATFGIAAIGVALYLPTLVQPFLQHKSFKIASRLMLGAAVPVLGIGGMAAPPFGVEGVLARSAFLLTFWGVLQATLLYRARFTPDPSQRCLPKPFPFCDGNRGRLATLLAELRDSACPEDADFVAFASAITDAAVSVETIQIDGFRQRCCSMASASSSGEGRPGISNGSCSTPSSCLVRR